MRPRSPEEPNGKTYRRRQRLTQHRTCDRLFEVEQSRSEPQEWPRAALRASVAPLCPLFQSEALAQVWHVSLSRAHVTRQALLKFGDHQLGAKPSRGAGATSICPSTSYVCGKRSWHWGTSGARYRDTWHELGSIRAAVESSTFCAPLIDKASLHVYEHVNSCTFTC